MIFDFNIELSIEEAKQLNPLVLAYIGDAAYEIFIRSLMVSKNKTMNVNKLHRRVVSFVKAHAQSEFMKLICNELNDEEMSIFKRGRNSKSATTPKNADIVEYRMATGFEALIGYLYITAQHERMLGILEKIIEEGGNQN